MIKIQLFDSTQQLLLKHLHEYRYLLTKESIVRLYAKNCFIEGVLINRLTFVDDLSEFAKSGKESDMRNVGAEVFEKRKFILF